MALCNWIKGVSCDKQVFLFYIEQTTVYLNAVPKGKFNMFV